MWIGHNKKSGGPRTSQFCQNLNFSTDPDQANDWILTQNLSNPRTPLHLIVDFDNQNLAGAPSIHPSQHPPTERYETHILGNTMTVSRVLLVLFLAVVAPSSAKTETRGARRRLAYHGRNLEERAVPNADLERRVEGGQLLDPPHLESPTYPVEIAQSGQGGPKHSKGKGGSKGGMESYSDPFAAGKGNGDPSYPHGTPPPMMYPPHDSYESMDNKSGKKGKNPKKTAKKGASGHGTDGPTHEATHPPTPHHSKNGGKGYPTHPPTVHSTYAPGEHDPFVPKDGKKGGSKQSKKGGGGTAKNSKKGGGGGDGDDKGGDDKGDDKKGDKKKGDKKGGDQKGDKKGGKNGKKGSKKGGSVTPYPTPYATPAPTILSGPPVSGSGPDQTRMPIPISHPTPAPRTQAPDMETIRPTFAPFTIGTSVPTSQGTITRELDNFILGYTPAVSRQPSRNELVELTDVTRVYLEFFMQQEFGQTTLTLLDSVSVRLVTSNFRANNPIIVEFDGTVRFNARSEIVPTEAQLIEGVANAFSPENVVIYMNTYLDALSASNVFRGAQVEFNPELSPAAQPSTSSRGGGVGYATAAVAFTLFVAGFVLYRRRSTEDEPEGKDVEKVGAGDMTVAGDTYTGETYDGSASVDTSSVYQKYKQKDEEEGHGGPVNLGTINENMDDASLTPVWPGGTMYQMQEEDDEDDEEEDDEEEDDEDGDDEEQVEKGFEENLEEAQTQKDDDEPEADVDDDSEDAVSVRTEDFMDQGNQANFMKPADEADSMKSNFQEDLMERDQQEVHEEIQEDVLADTEETATALSRLEQELMMVGNDDDDDDVPDLVFDDNDDEEELLTRPGTGPVLGNARSFEEVALQEPSASSQQAAVTRSENDEASRFSTSDKSHFFSPAPSQAPSTSEIASLLSFDESEPKEKEHHPQPQPEKQVQPERQARQEQREQAQEQEQEKPKTTPNVRPSRTVAEIEKLLTADLLDPDDDDESAVLLGGSTSNARSQRPRTVAEIESLLLSTDDDESVSVATMLD